MAVTGDVFCGMLLSTHAGTQFGRDLGQTALLTPRQYRAGMTLREGGIYIASSDDLPKDAKTPCLFVCPESKPHGSWGISRQRILALDDCSHDTALDDALDAYERISLWESHMQACVLDGAEITKLVETTLPLLGNSITVTDHDLRFLAFCKIGPDGLPHLSMVESHVPVESLPYLSEKLGPLMRNHDPFFLRDEDGDVNYCVNVFSGGSYVGCCSIVGDSHPLQAFELALFRQFAGFVETALSLRAKRRKTRTPTLEIVLAGMLDGSRPSARDLRRALEMFLEGNGLPYDTPTAWTCAVISEGGRAGSPSVDYVKDELGRCIPRSCAIERGGRIACFAFLDDPDAQEGPLGAQLQPLLENLGLTAGVSRAFQNISHAYDHYLQAQVALSTGAEHHPEERCHLFADCELDYLLGCCTHELGAASLVPPELVELSHMGENGVDYVGTLRTYLDCDCTASRAAKRLYLHRSTMMQRLERIREMVDLEDEREKLLLRIVLHLPDLTWGIMQIG